MFYDMYADFQKTLLENGLSVYTKEWPNASWFYAGVVTHTGARGATHWGKGWPISSSTSL